MDQVQNGRLTAWQMLRGEDWERTLIFWADAAKTTRSDMTGYTAVAEVRRSPDAADVLLTLSTAVNGPQGEVALICPHSQSNIIQWQTGVMDVKLTDPGGNVSYIPRLPFSIIPTVTR